MGAVDALQTSQVPRTRDWIQFYPPRAHMNTTWLGGLQTGAGTLLFPSTSASITQDMHCMSQERQI